MPRMDENKVYRVSGKCKVEYCDEGGMVRIVRFPSPAEMGEFIAKLDVDGYCSFGFDVE